MCEVVVAAESAFEGGDLGRPDAEVPGGGCDADSSGLAQWSQVVSSGHFGWVGEQSVDLAADRSFEASHGLFGGLSLDSLLVNRPRFPAAPYVGCSSRLRAA